MSVFVSMTGIWPPNFGMVSVKVPFANVNISVCPAWYGRVLQCCPNGMATKLPAASEPRVCMMISPEYIWTPALAEAAKPKANRVAANIRWKPIFGCSFASRWRYLGRGVFVRRKIDAKRG
jgi:hypothetical protein